MTALVTRSAEETRAAGVLLGALLRPGDVIALAGDLGAGKTHLVQGVARALGVSGPVTSPTFNLLLAHPGTLPLYHFDLYRLDAEEELEQIAFYETLESDGVSMIEWGDRFPGALPADHLLVRIHRVGETARRLDLAWGGPRAEEVAEAWVAAWRTATGGAR